MSGIVAGADFFDISPTCNIRINGRAKENNVVVPVLSLVQFSRPPFVTFGTVKLGSSKSLPLCIENPTEDATVTVTVEKIPSSKGFSVDKKTLIIPPEDNAIINVTWTPSEEGGVRELLSFTANGIIKHQAILLGKAEGAKPRKKCLWDTIKSKKGASQSAKVASIPIKTNKTFRVSRQPQYKRNQASNPLTPINREKPKVFKEKTSQSVYPWNPQAKCDDLGSISPHNMSPVVLLVPAIKFIDAMGKENISNVPLQNVDPKVLNKTLSPIRTPERFLNPLMPCFQSPLPVICKPIMDEGSESRQILPSEDAVAVINSDLSCLVSPPNACSSLNLANSLESDDLCMDAKIEMALNASFVSPQVDVAQPRLTFFVKSNKFVDNKLDPAVSFASDNKLDDEICDNGLNQEDISSKTIHFNSATVIKNKAGVSSEHSSDTCQIRTFRRKLLQNAPLVTPSPESDRDLLQGVSVLPVIDSDVCNLKFNAAPLQGSEPMSRQPILVEPTTSPYTAEQSIQNFTTKTNTNSAAFNRNTSEKPYRISKDPFPVHRHAAKRNRKRTSEGYLTENSEVLPKSVEVKKTTETQEYKKSCCENPSQLKCKKIPRTAASASEKSAKVPLQKSNRKSTQHGGRQMLKSFSSSKVKTAKVIAVAQTHLNFLQPVQTVIPRHPLPFAAKNMFYDERWIEKQEHGFTWWMNYVLTPDEFKVEVTEVSKVNALSLTIGSGKINIPKAPTKEEMSYRTYTARRHLNSIRRAACQLFMQDKMAKAIKRLEVEVEAKRLLIRKDRHLWKDIGERQKVLNWLLAYNPLWLRVGLETIFGEMICLESNSDTMGLAVFILGRLLWNPDIAAEFRHPKVPHLYRDGHEEALSRFTLKKLLLLVCFLDKAKESRLIEHDPCLFCLDAEFKTSKDLLLAFSRDFLSGEGILPRHLGLLGLAVSHVQTPLEEFSFAVHNLATDLRCGIRLVRLMEVLTQDWSLSSKLRMPAVSRLQKVHNVTLALQVLRKKGVDLKDAHGTLLDPRDIVDGHREKTLNLLWKIIFCFQVEVLLDLEQLKQEISFLKETRRTKQKLHSLKNATFVVKTVKERTADEHPNEKLTLLLDWVNAVCTFYGLKAENFTVSFSDGRILCYLIHHYHPNHLKAEDIQSKTSQTIDCGFSKPDLNSSSESDFSHDSLEQKDLVSTSVDFKSLLENEQRNFQLVSLAVSYLGGIPAMIIPEDMSNTIPDEKVVTCYLSFLCARLLDLRNEMRAARVIQSMWRRYNLRKHVQINQLQNQAAKKLQTHVHHFLQKKRLKRQNTAATIIQATWRGHLAREELRSINKAKCSAVREAAALQIQKTYKKWKTRLLLERNRAAVVIQTTFRKWHARKLTVENSAAVKIQSCYRMHQCRSEYLSKKSKAVFIQAWFKANYQRRKFQSLKKRHQSAVIIQSAFRAFRIRKQMGIIRQAAIFIQRWYKACWLKNKEQKHYKDMKSAAIRLQAAFRGMKTRRRISKQHQAALVIQTAYRRFVAQNVFLYLKQSVVRIQRLYRAKTMGKQLRSWYLSMKGAAIKIQAIWRGQKDRKKISLLHQQATVIQSFYRRHVVQRRFIALKQAAFVIQKQYKYFRMTNKTRLEFLLLRQAVLVLQSVYRGMRVRRDLATKSKAAAVIQSTVRAFSCRKKFLAQKHAAIVLQQHFRAFLQGQMERQHYRQLKQTTTRLQAIFRGCKLRRELKTRHHAATVIQKYFRTYKVQVCFIAFKAATTIIQRRYRAYKLSQRTYSSYQLIKSATITIQSAYRGMQVRRTLQNMHRAATVIQAHACGHLQLMEYRRRKRAAIILQRQFRANKLKDIVEKQYITVKTAVVCIQSAYRTMIVRKRILEMHMAAKVIQRNYRMHKQYNQYQALRRATVFVQRKYQATVLTRKERESYCVTQKAVRTLQAWYRGMKSRRELKNRHQAVTLIQATFKMYKTKMLFQAMRIAAILIQRHYRVYKERKYFLSIRAAVRLCQQKYRARLSSQQQRKAYLEKYRAVLTIQAGHRGMKVRQQMKLECKAAVIIQSHFRKNMKQKYYQRLTWASRTLQRCYRANKIRKLAIEFLRKEQAATVLQAAFRGMKDRKELTHKHKACIVIQRVYRAHRVQVKYLSMKYAIIAIQQKFRAVLSAQSQREQFLRLRRAAVITQAIYRGHCVRREMTLQHRASTVIQAAFRKHREKTKYQAMKLSALIIQRHYRSCVETKAIRTSYLALKNCAICLQAAYRGYSVRQTITQMHKAATVIQAAVRMHKERLMFKRYQWATKVLQDRFIAWKLGNQQRQRYRHLKDATVCLQKSFRGKKSRDLVKRLRAVMTIQSYVRMFVQRRHFMKTKAAAVSIQHVYRAHYHRVQKSKRLKAAISIQHWYRSCILVQEERNTFKTIQKATLTLQHAFQNMLTRKNEIRKLAACKIQSILLMNLFRRRYIRLRSCAIKLQANYRMRTARKGYLRQHAAAVTVERFYRAHRAKLEKRQQYRRTLHCVKALQAQVRRIIAQRKFQKMRTSAVKIQAFYRGMIERRKFQQLRKSACVLQKHYRAYRLGQTERARFLQLRTSVLLIQAKEVARRHRFTAAAYHHLCALKIQRALRIYWALNSAKTQMSSVVYIQRWFLARLQRRRYLEQRQKIIVVQRAVKAWLHHRNEAATVIQGATKRFLLRLRKERLQRGMLKLQALWRGHQSRRLNDAAEVISIRHRLRKITRELKEEDKLCHKTTVALSYLLEYQNYAHILSALKHLETATRLLPESCEHLVNSGATHTIFTLIRSCNRSVPSMEIITLAIQVLLNLSKYNKTIDAVYDVEDAVETLLDLLQMYREKAGDKVADKGGSIFTKVCFLLVILVQEEKRALVKNIPRASERICRIYNLMLQKCKINAQKTKVKQRMNGSLIGNCPPNAIPQKRVLRFVPDWVLEKKKMHNIVDPLSAIQALVASLAIGP